MEVHKIGPKRHDYVYSIDSVEAQVIVTAFKKECRLIELKIQRIITHPKNEGQATYSYKVDILRSQLNHYRKNIELLKE